MYHVEHELLKENPVFSKFYLSGCNLQTQRRTDIFSCNLPDCYLLTRNSLRRPTVNRKVNNLCLNYEESSHFSS